MTIVAPGAGSTVTANDLIKRAMRLAGVLGKGETPDDDEAQNGLEALNAMLESWLIQKLFVYATIAEVFQWASGEQSRTLGPGGDFDTDRPAQVADDCSFTSSSVDYLVRLINLDAWSAIPAKTTQSSFPMYLYPEYGAELITLYAYPIPNATVQFNCRSWKLLQLFETLTSSNNLPLGSARAIAFSLAEEWAAPEFGMTLQPSVVRTASSARRALKRINAATTPVMVTEVGVMTRRRSAYIRGDIN